MSKCFTEMLTPLLKVACHAEEAVDVLCVAPRGGDWDQELKAFLFRKRTLHWWKG